MSKTYGTMKSNVGNFVQQTDDNFAALIGSWLNDKYLDIYNRCEWSIFINFDYTFPTVVGTSEYALETDFSEEIFVANITDGIPLTRYTEGTWWQERFNAYQAGTITNGQSKSYIILREASKIHLDPPPDAIKTIAMPYKKSLTALSATGDIPVIKDIEYILEYGATAEAYAYLKQFSKADYYAQKYEQELSKRISRERTQSNQLYQRIPGGNKLPYYTRLTGEASYDTI